MNKTLLHPDSYDPVETVVDSAFSPKDDPSFIETLVGIGELNEQYTDLENKAKIAQRMMSMISGPYMSAFEKNEYNTNKEEYDKAIEQMEKLSSKMQEKAEEVVNTLKEKPEFIGFKATHRYRAHNNAGQTVFGNTFFLLDKSFKNILFSCEQDEYDEVQNAIKQIIETINN